MTLSPEQKKKVAKLVHQFKDSMRNLIGKPLFDPETFEEALAGVRRGMASFISEHSGSDNVAVAVRVDPDDSSKAIVTLTGKNKAGDKFLQAYLDKKARLDAAAAAGGRDGLELQLEKEGMLDPEEPSP